MHHRSAFTLIELLVVIAIIAVLAVVVVLTLNPAGLFQEARDYNRISDMATLNSAISNFSADVFTTGALGNANTVYVSIPDPTATSSAGDQCQGLGLLSLPAGYTYQCAASSTYRLTNGTGWIPINFSNATFGAPFSKLPTDPVNSSSSRLYYTYETNGQKLEVTAVMESSKYQLGGSSDVISGDGGTLASVYEKGSVTGLEPLDYGDSSLVGYWTFDEGQSSTAYDSSGNNATGSWSGTQAGTNGYYSPGKIGSWAGYFNATDDYVNVTNTSFNLSSSGYTFSEWLNLATSSASANPALMGISSGANIGFYLESAGTGYNIKPWAGGSAQVFATNTPFSSWHLVTVTYAGYGSLLRTVYVDGVSAGTESDGSMGAWSGVRIGYNQYYPSVVPSGLIDDVRIYNRALSAAQIAAMYNAGK